jgi:hypothetical protein
MAQAERGQIATYREQAGREAAPYFAAGPAAKT